MTHPRPQWLMTLALSLTTVLAFGCGRQSGAPTAADGIVLSSSDDELGPGSAIPFSDAQIYLEYNSTAGDAGIQVFLDAEDWQRVSISDGQGKDILSIQTGGGMRELGLTELRFEGAEPEPSEVLDVFPAGAYSFAGMTIDRIRLTASAFLSHDIPAAPNFSPSHGEVVDADNVVIQWDPIGGVDRYQVIVESDANNLSMEVSVSPSITSLHVPPTFLAPDTEYKAEVLAIAPDGNRTITEGTFVTGP